MSQSYEGASTPPADIIPHFWDCTRVFMPPERKVSWHDETAPLGTDKVSGLPIIGRFTSINPGVWINAGERLVIDDSDARDRADYQAVVGKVEKRLEQISTSTGRNLSVDVALRVVSAMVRKAIPFNPEAAVQSVYGASKGGVVPLSLFMRRGGVCIHQIALGGYVCEQLDLRGILDVETRLNRNRKHGEDGPGHAWSRLRYRPSGITYIMDTLQDVVGVIDEMGEDHWPYRQPDDPTIYTANDVE